MSIRSQKEKKQILVVGQTPPPYHGQAMMTKRLVDAVFQNITIIHVRMAFSESSLEIGKASWKKIIHMFSIACHILKYRLKYRHLVLYYMPAGPNKIPVIRDLVLLSLVRPFFKRTVYHFRAAGISEFLNKQSFVLKELCKWIYGKPTVGIQLSEKNPADAAFFSAKNIRFIPNGLEDNYIYYNTTENNHSADTIKILFVGILRQDKGFSWLIESLDILINSGASNFHLYAMGEFASLEYKNEVLTMIKAYKLEPHVTFLGIKIGSEKWSYFLASDFLCFPTYFDCESFGNVLVEAMMFSLPVISSEWRGTSDIVKEDTGFLIPVNDKKQLANKIELLIKDKQLRKEMGTNARIRYLKMYTLTAYLNNIESVLESI